MTADREIQMPPWRTPVLWRDVNHAMTVAVERQGPGLSLAVDLARRIEQEISSLDEAMDALCSANCPSCADSCCERAMIWYDFKDLILLHLVGGTLPAAQLIRRTGQPCPNQGASGCLLPRRARPFICTWYLCPRQKADLCHCQVGRQQNVIRSLSGLKQDRIELENLFIRSLLA